MDWYTFEEDTEFNGDEPGRYDPRRHPQRQLEVVLLEDTRVEEKDGVFGEGDAYGINCFVGIAERIVSARTMRFVLGCAYNDLNQ